jgi:hypothetical protein
MIMTDATNLLVFLVVVLARFGVPLFIPRYPVPAIVAALLIDAADQTIFQQLTTLNLDGYQSYDKALDIYYLAIAYLSTLRNWADQYAFKVSRFLYFYRLVGATAFELSGYRALLLIFPNTFEYFFIWYESIRTRWSLRRLSPQRIFQAAAFIWIVIKLPQETWIHIAKLDTTDLMRENPWIAPLILVIIAAAAVAIWRNRSRIPRPDWPLTFDVDQHLGPVPVDALAARGSRSIRHGLFEKIVLVGLITIIFSQLIPDLEASTIAIMAAVAYVITVNAFISQWLAQRGTHWRSIIQEFLVMAVINLSVGLLGLFLLPGRVDNFRLASPLFFTFLLTLIVTLYDRYRPIHDARRVMAGEDRPVVSEPGIALDTTPGT